MRTFMATANLFSLAFKKNFSTLVFAALIALLPLRGEIVFTSLSPTYGPTGTDVVLSGTGFPNAGDLFVTVGGANATIVERRTDLLRFTIPVAATTGLVKVTADGVDYKFGAPFTVTRFINAQIAPEMPIVAANYTVGTLYSDAPGTAPNYVVEVAKGEATLVAASADEADPVLMAIVTDAQSSVVLSAQSTAMALLLSVPGVQTLNQAEATARVNFFAARPESTTLRSAIQSRVAAGEDYLEHPSVTSPMLVLLQGFANDYRPAPRPALPQQQALNVRDDFVNGVQVLASGFPRDLEAPGYQKLRKLVTSNEGTSVNDRGLPVIKIKVTSAPSTEPLLNFIDANPLDWMANLYELSPADVDLNSLEKVRNLQGDFINVYDRVSPLPLGSMNVKAKLAFRVVDLPDLISETVVASVSPAGLPAKEHLEIPADRPGLYMIRAFSGARFPPQAGLISNLPGGQAEAIRMTALNFVLALAEGLTLYGKELLARDCFEQYLAGLVNAVVPTLTREGAQGNLTAEAISRIWVQFGKSYVRDYVLKCLVLDRGRKGTLHTGKVLLSCMNLAGAFASGGKVIERLAALGNLVGSTGEPQRVWTAQAIEDTLVVVGNPWQPQITWFYPQSDYRGALVSIQGRNFSTVTNQNIVTFGVLSTDPTNPPVTARAEVLIASVSSLLVRVPENAQSGVITVTVAGKGTATTADLDPPVRIFRVQPDPVITGISPNPPVAGQLMEIHGVNFVTGYEQRQELVFGSGVIIPVFGKYELLRVRTPNSTALNSVRVRIRTRESNVFPFTPVLPPTISTGATIYVSTALDSQAADGDISLREAILLANGGTDALGRQLTSPPSPRPPNTTYETDYISPIAGGGLPGAAAKDFIRAHARAVGTNVLVGSPLPPLENFDDYDLTLKINGGGGDGIRMIGSDIQFRADVIRNFSGHGVLLSGTAFNNHIRQTLVENCGGAGFMLEGRALANTLFGVTAKGCQHGLHLSGTGVAFNKADGVSIFYSEFTANRNFGVLIDGGATMNELILWSVNSNNSGGIRITGPETILNIVRKPNEFPHVARDRVGHIYANGGPGIWINSPSNMVRGFNVRGNAGDGILIEDALCRDVVVQEVGSGFNDENGLPDPNQGSGLHIRNGAHEIVVGAGDAGMDGSSNVGANSFCGNRDHGILITGAGTHNIRVNLTGAGGQAPAYARDPEAPAVMPNGIHGIAVTDNAHSVTIGGPVPGVSIMSHTNGAGIYLEQTSSNLVFGCQVVGNDYGIRLTQNAFANVIGTRGTQQVMRVNFVNRVFDTRNQFYGNREAAILLEAGGDPTHTIGPGELPTGGNVIQNNLFGDGRFGFENKVGILIRDGARLNRIGGAEPGDGNVFSSNTDAGILIDGAVISRRFLANRIIGNTFMHQGGFFSGNLGDPLSELPGGVGIALVNSASGHIIGGNNPGEGNIILENYVGIQMVHSGQNVVIGNRIDNNRVAGVVLLESLDNTIGPLNEIYRNAARSNGLGGIVLKSSISNTVVGNWIGIPKGNVVAHGTRDYGIALLDSAQNVIGDFGGKNIIYGPTNGIVISGPDSFFNHVAFNHIGITPGPPFFQIANRYAGVLLADGAHDNMIGGERPLQIGAQSILFPAPNHIQLNTNGVLVDGPRTIGNGILFNSISDHTAGLGIENIGLGNDEIPPPSLVSHDGVNIVGAVDPSVPDGSLVQIFSDNADEGRTFQGQAFVVGGQFRFVIPMLAGSRLNATVTDPIDGNTSEFAPLVIHTNSGAGLLVQRVTRPPATNSLPVPGAMGVAVAFRLRAFANPVLVSSMTFRTTGTANEASPGTRAFLFRDEDRNGQLGQADFLLSGPRSFSANNANLFFPSLGRVIDPGADQDWLLVVLPSTNAAVGETFSFELPSEGSMTSRVLMTGETITESGEFPLLSDTLLVSSGAPSSDLRIGRAADGQLVLDWTGEALLESALEVTGPWSLIPDASVPFIVVPTQDKEFFRFRP
jgi:parallel beta-helix repeat protein